MACVDYVPVNKIIPSVTLEHYYPICYEDFFLLYSKEHRSGIITLELLNKKMIEKSNNVVRNDKFHEEQIIPKKYRVSLDDYVNLNKSIKTSIKYDRGHLAPESNRTSYTASYHAFSLANMIPQISTVNRGVWKKVEQDIRKYSETSNNNIYILTGVVFNGKMENNMNIPSSMYKKVYEEKINKSWGYLVENKQNTTVTYFNGCNETKKLNIFYPKNTNIFWFGC